MASVSVVITSHDQGSLIAEAVESAWNQTLQPAEVIVVDDGSTDPRSIEELRYLDADVIVQQNAGVSAARNAGIRLAISELVVVLDGDDRLAPTFVEKTAAMMAADGELAAASSWLRMFGVVDAVVAPSGGSAQDFLARNSCPANALIRRDRWRQAGGYDESMRDGFEDWDFFLSLLEDGGRIGIVPEPLIEYRTSPVSANVRSMAARMERVGDLIDRHADLYARHMREAFLAWEARSIRVDLRREELLRRHPEEPLDQVSFGDGGMASAVRIASHRASTR